MERIGVVLSQEYSTVYGTIETLLLLPQGRLWYQCSCSSRSAQVRGGAGRWRQLSIACCFQSVELATICSGTLLMSSLLYFARFGCLLWCTTETANAVVISRNLSWWWKRRGVDPKWINLQISFRWRHLYLILRNPTSFFGCLTRAIHTFLRGGPGAYVSSPA